MSCEPERKKTSAWGSVVQISNFGLKPRIRRRPDSCELHGEHQRTLVEGFRGDNTVIGCPRCRFDAEHGADEAARDAALASKRWEKINGALFATGIPVRFRRCSLDNYQADLPGQKSALDACRDYAGNLPQNLTDGRSLLLLGNYGNGKTHLGCAILVSAVVDHDISALYAPAADIISAIKSSFSRDSETSERDIHAELASVDLLLLDEIGAQGGTEFERQVLHQIIDARYRNMLPTIVTSNLPSSELAAYIGDRALDRLRENGGMAVSFDWESARGGM